MKQMKDPGAYIVGGIATVLALLLIAGATIATLVYGVR